MAHRTVTWKHRLTHNSNRTVNTIIEKSSLPFVNHIPNVRNELMTRPSTQNICLQRNYAIDDIMVCILTNEFCVDNDCLARSLETSDIVEPSSFPPESSCSHWDIVCFHTSFFQLSLYNNNNNNNTLLKTHQNFCTHQLQSKGVFIVGRWGFIIWVLMTCHGVKPWWLRRTLLCLK